MCIVLNTNVNANVCVCVSVEVSTRMVSEYKTKLQISEAENSRLEGTVSVCVYMFMY